MAQCGRTQRCAAAVLRHQGGKLLHCALWRFEGHRSAFTGDPFSLILLPTANDVYQMPAYSKFSPQCTAI